MSMLCNISNTSASVIAMFLVTSPFVINVPTRGLFAGETMHAIVQWLENLNIKRNMTSVFVNKKHRYTGVSKHENWWKCLETPVKHEARVFEMASQSVPNSKQKNIRTQKSHQHVIFAFFCLISAHFVMILSVFYTSEACLFQVITICIQWSSAVPKHGRVSWGWILLVSTAQKCARRFFACTVQP